MYKSRLLKPIVIAKMVKNPRRAVCVWRIFGIFGGKCFPKRWLLFKSAIMRIVDVLKVRFELVDTEEFDGIVYNSVESDICESD